MSEDADGEGPGVDRSVTAGAANDSTGTAGDGAANDPGTTDDTDTAEVPDTAEEPIGDVADRTTARRSLSSRVQLVWGIRMLVGAVVLTLGASFLSMTVDPVPPWAGAAFGAAVLALGAAWVHLRYRVWVYEVREDSLYLERGVLTHVRTIAPYVRIQHVDTQRGPLERWLGLSTLVVYTAGTRGADVSIPGLTPEEARDLQSRVKELAIRAEGGDAV